MKAMKLGRAVASALASVGLVSQMASATTICETQVPTSVNQVQTMTICAATNAGKADGKVTKQSAGSNSHNGTYKLEVNWTGGVVDAKVHIVDAVAGNIVTDGGTGGPCTARDTTLNTGVAASFTCHVSSSLNQQLFMYVIAG